MLDKYIQLLFLTLICYIVYGKLVLIKIQKDFSKINTWS